MAERKPFTGRDRKRRTRWGVRLVDWLARTVITFGGIGTIVAISLVAVSLVLVSAPLFTSAKVDDAGTIPAPWKSASPVRIEVDEYQTLGWSLLSDGTLHVVRVDTGEVLEARRLAEEGPPSIAAAFPEQSLIALGFPDGAAQLWKVEIASEFIPPDRLTDELRALEPGSAIPWEGGLVERTPQGEYRRQSVTITPQPRLEVGTSAVKLVDLLPRSDGPLLAALLADGTIRTLELRAQENLVTGETQFVIDGEHAIPPSADASNPARLPAFLRLIGRGENLIVAWSDGRFLRYDRRKPDHPVVAQQGRFVESEGARLTALEPLLGRATLLAGDSAGGLAGWFMVRRTDKAGNETPEFVRAKPLPTSSAGVTAISSSRRTRVVAAGYANGHVRMFHVTSGKSLGEVNAGEGAAVEAVVAAPKDDGVLAATTRGIHRWSVDLKHPEASLPALFLPVWYEGYPEPQHVWQSTGGSVDAEPKLGMMPLIFGTFKATFYAMLFGTPLALLSAIYTSEFLDRRTRAKVKPAIETMASLPSVVLGFLAALVFAPFVESRVPMLLAALVLLPTLIMSGAYLWQLLPSGITVRFAHLRIAVIAALIPLAAALSWLSGPWVERLLFSGDLMRWLDGRRTRETFGSPLGGWFYLLLPLSACAVAALVNRFLMPVLVRKHGRGDRTRFAVWQLGTFAFGVAATLLFDLLLSGALTGLGFDPRGTFVGTYVQRNAMIVGFVMGFAIIPIIYTIADDALTSVPEQLRSASLGAGATPWQTAIRIVIPTAMSGLFSAIMVGLGRAVGETMIVLMAAGNTPEISWNPFNGFRTLSANIAVELPEAVGTHYRILFLAGLTLFILTFFVNTFAEFVRQRFRKRMYQL